MTDSPVPSNPRSAAAADSVLRRTAPWTLAGILVGVLGAAYGIWLIADWIEERRRAAPTPAVVYTEVRASCPDVARVPRRDEVSGFLGSPATIAVAAEVQGVLREKLAVEGRAVVEGETIAVIDDELYRAKLDSIRARRRATEARRAFLEKDLPRVRRLVEQDALGRTELDRIESELASLEAARDEVAAIELEAEIWLRKCRVVAPRAGVWLEDLAHAGDHLAPGRPIGRLRVVDPLEVEVQVAADVRLGLEAGREVEVTLRDLDAGASGRENVALARVARLPPGDDPATRRFPIVLEVPNADGRLLPGLFVVTTIERPREGPLLLVPKEAIFERWGQTTAWVIVPLDAAERRELLGSVPEATAAEALPTHRVVMRPVTVQAVSERIESWHVASGLEADDLVVREPIREVAHGDLVRVRGSRDASASPAGGETEARP